ncbi:MAG TPA: glycosyl transferase, partial [Acetobacteraceae bacterium]|nr:glycosyl transferase [Acetobacteraceae bacterium]
MTTFADAAASIRANAKRRHKLLHPATLLALGLSATVSLGAWTVFNQPQPAPDFSGRIGGLGFSPFHRGESPQRNEYPSAAEISHDLAQAAHLTDRIRVYSVEGPMAQIPALAAPYHLKVTLGAWLTGKQAADEAQIQRLITTTNANADVDHVLVGDETVLHETVSPAQLTSYIAEVKQGVHVPVSTAEPWHVWLAHPELAASVDYITVHLFPYWEGVPEKAALDDAMAKFHRVQDAYPNKHIVIGEIGWPSNGVQRDGAVASRVNQARFMRAFFNLAQAQHLDYFAFEAFDQPWKTSFEGRAAGYWGLFDLDRHAKWSFAGPVMERPHWLGWALGATVGATLLAALLLRRRPDIRFPGKLLVAGLMQGFATVFALVLLAMADKYLSFFAAGVWGALAAGQALLLFLLMADSFELAETIFGTET